MGQGNRQGVDVKPVIPSKVQNLAIVVAAAAATLLVVVVTILAATDLRQSQIIKDARDSADILKSYDRSLGVVWSKVQHSNEMLSVIRAYKTARPSLRSLHAGMYFPEFVDREHDAIAFDEKRIPVSHLLAHEMLQDEVEGSLVLISSLAPAGRGWIWRTQYLAYTEDGVASNSLWSQSAKLVFVGVLTVLLSSLGVAVISTVRRRKDGESEASHVNS